MKKIIALFLAAAVFVLAGCSDTNKDYSALLPFVNGSADNKIEVTLALADNDSRMITGSPAASTAGAEFGDANKIKIVITGTDGSVLFSKDDLNYSTSSGGDIDYNRKFYKLYINKTDQENLKAATVTVCGMKEVGDSVYKEFTKGTLTDVDLTLGKTIYVPMEYIVTENEAGHSGNITFSVGYYNQADWENNGFDVSKVEDTPTFEVSYTPLNGDENELEIKDSENLYENGYFVKITEGIPVFLKFRIEDESGYYKLKVIWKDCPVIVNGFNIKQDVEMIIANDNIFCIPNYGSVKIDTYYEPKFYMPVKNMWAVNGEASGSGETMASPESLNTLLSTIASEDAYNLYSINCSKLATVKKSSYGNSYCMYDVTSINNITCTSGKYINIKSTDVDASMVIQSNEGRMIAIANESIAVTKCGDGEAFLPAKLQAKSESGYYGNITESFDFILEKGAKVDILNKDFTPNVLNVYVDDSYHIYQEGTDNYNSYEDWSSCCFARLDIGEDDNSVVLDNENCSIYIYDSDEGQYVRFSEGAIDTIIKYTEDNLKRYKLFYLKQN